VEVITMKDKFLRLLIVQCYTFIWSKAVGNKCGGALTISNIRASGVAQTVKILAIKFTNSDLT
jgi:hypothetical protein